MTYEPSPVANPVERSSDRGPFDIIGDVHGCADELDALFDALGYAADDTGLWRSPGRMPVFIGDLVDRGPQNADVLRLVMAMVDAGRARCVTGNHDLRLERYLGGEPVTLDYGLATTVAELQRAPAEFRNDVLTFLRSLPGHYVLDGGHLVVAHAGLEEALHGDPSSDVRRLAGYGVLGGDVDPTDLAKRHPWIAAYRGRAVVVYGHTPVTAVAWHGNTIDIDTGCVFGGRLTALRWPEREIVSVGARQAYAEPNRPLVSRT